jgi:hypothetical protein
MQPMESGQGTKTTNATAGEKKTTDQPMKQTPTSSSSSHGGFGNFNFTPFGSTAPSGSSAGSGVTGGMVNNSAIANTGAESPSKSGQPQSQPQPNQQRKSIDESWVNVDWSEVSRKSDVPSSTTATASFVAPPPPIAASSSANDHHSMSCNSLYN